MYCIALEPLRRRKAGEAAGEDSRLTWTRGGASWRRRWRRVGRNKKEGWLLPVRKGARPEQSLLLTPARQARSMDADAASARPTIAKAAGSIIPFTARRRHNSSCGKSGEGLVGAGCENRCLSPWRTRGRLKPKGPWESVRCINTYW